MSYDTAATFSTTQHETRSLPEAYPRRTAVSAAVDPVALVVTECITVTSAMRKHARWAHSSVAAILGGGTTRALPSPRRERGTRDSAGSPSPGQDQDALASRWGLRGKKGKSMQDNPLMAAFARLRNDLKGCKGISCQHETFGGKRGCLDVLSCN